VPATSGVERSYFPPQPAERQPIAIAYFEKKNGAESARSGGSDRRPFRHVSEDCPSSRMATGRTRAQSVTLSPGTQVTHCWKPHNAECPAIARALETAALQPLAHEHITIHADAQAAIPRMGLDEPGLARDTPPRRGSTPQPSSGKGWGLRSNSAGVLPTLKPTRGYQGTRTRMNGRRWQRTSQTLTAWNVSGLVVTGQRRQPPWVAGAPEALDHRGQVARSKGRQNPRLYKILPVEDGSLPYWPIPRADKEAVHR